MDTPVVRPDSSNFLGVALVINRNRDGPRFVFHYPNHIPPLPSPSKKEPSLDQLDYSETFNDNATRHQALGNTRDFMPSTTELARWNHDDHLVAGNGTQFVPWEYVAGLPTKTLGGILTPPRAFHKKRFQLTLDSVCYVGYPIHVPASGSWAKERVRKRKVRRNQGAVDGNDEQQDSSMTMFSLVFIMCPRQHELGELPDIMFRHVVREVNKVYKYLQETGDFVWQECKKIFQLKDKGRETRTKMSLLWDEILAASSLAASMRDVYEAICNNKTAVLELSLGSGSVGHSVQIPIPFFTGDVHPQTAEAAKAVWATTARTVAAYDVLGGLSVFDKCFGLLLTDENDDKIIADLQTRGGKAATAMIELVKTAKPTLSFHQIAQLPDTILTIQQVRAYAQHFIFWRRAMAVPPLNVRDVYLLSPNCNLASLPTASASFAQAFPFAPALTDLLASLSAAPRQYKAFCPSKSLRPAYLRILAWLIRGGWVCQLCTFAYVVVWPEIQYEVDYELEAAQLARAKQKQQQRQARGPGRTEWMDTTTSIDTDFRYRPSDSSDYAEDESSPAVSDIVSSSPPSLHAQNSSRASAHADGSSRPSAAEHAAERARRQRIAETAAHSLAERATAHARKPTPSPTEHPSVNKAHHLAGMVPHIILDASKPTGRESLYLAAIQQHLRNSRALVPPTSKKDADRPAVDVLRFGAATTRPGNSVDAARAWNDRVGEMWPILWKHFNGRSALERVALIEDMKRKDVSNLLSAMSEHLLCIKHM